MKCSNTVSSHTATQLYTFLSNEGKTKWTCIYSRQKTF